MREIGFLSAGRKNLDPLGVIRNLVPFRRPDVDMSENVFLSFYNNGYSEGFPWTAVEKTYSQSIARHVPCGKASGRPGPRYDNVKVGIHNL